MHLAISVLNERLIGSMSQFLMLVGLHYCCRNDGVPITIGTGIEPIFLLEYFITHPTETEAKK